MRALALVAWLASVAGAAACGPDDDAPIELRFWGMGREGEVVGELVREFERQNPGTRTIVMGCYATRDPAHAAHRPALDQTRHEAGVGRDLGAARKTVRIVQRADHRLGQARAHAGSYRWLV